MNFSDLFARETGGIITIPEFKRIFDLGGDSSVAQLFQQIYENDIVDAFDDGVTTWHGVFALISLWYLVSWSMVHKGERSVKVVNVLPNPKMLGIFEEAFEALVRETGFNSDVIVSSNSHNRWVYRFWPEFGDMFVFFIVPRSGTDVAGFCGHHMMFLTYDADAEIIDVARGSICWKHDKLFTVDSRR